MSITDQQLRDALGAREMPSWTAAELRRINCIEMVVAIVLTAVTFVWLAIYHARQREEFERAEAEIAAMRTSRLTAEGANLVAGAFHAMSLAARGANTDDYLERLQSNYADWSREVAK